VSDPGWKKVERRVARYLGVERTPLSGRSSRHGTSSDSLHPLLYVEVKHGKNAERVLRSRPRLERLFAEIEKRALAEWRVPVLVLHPPRWGNGGVGNYPAYVRIGWGADAISLPQIEPFIRLRENIVMQVPLAEVARAEMPTRAAAPRVSRSSPKGVATRERANEYGGRRTSD
jgi:hypothetical protein